MADNPINRIDPNGALDTPLAPEGSGGGILSSIGSALSEVASIIGKIVKDASEQLEKSPPTELSQQGINLLIELEGFIPYVYDDKDKSNPRKRWEDSEKQGTPTIGIGIVVDKNKADKGEIEDITLEEAIKMKHAYLN